MPMNWDEAAKAKLFAGVLATSDFKVDYKALADYMGGECTAKAITHQIAKIKADAREQSNSSPNTPATAAKKTPKTTGKRKATKKDADDSGDGEESPTKAKKARTTKAKAKSKSPAAAAEDNGDEIMDGVKAEEDAGPDHEASQNGEAA